MAKFAPQYNLFKINDKIEKTNQYIFWLIITLSITSTFPINCSGIQTILDIINILNILGIIIFFLLETIGNYFLIPMADSIRRDDFIDNSWGSKLSLNNSIEYYDNDEVNVGLYKTAINLFENCYFTFSLVKVTTSKKIIMPFITMLILLVFAYYGFKKVPLHLSILQALLSANIIGKLIKHIILYAKLKSMLDCWIDLFQNKCLRDNIGKYQPLIYRYWLRYEVLICNINSGVPEEIYKKYNPSLSDEWKKIKHNYGIN